MKLPSLFSGVAAALGLAVTGSVLGTALFPIFGAAEGLQLLLAVLTFGYVVYLFKSARVAVGHITTLLVWAVSSAIFMWSSVSLAAFVLLQVGFIWLSRSMAFHRSTLAVCLDMGITTLGLLASAATLSHSGSLGLSIWVFFLAQSLFCFIPHGFTTGTSEQRPEDSFSRAQRNAEDALRRLSMNSSK